MLRRWTKYRKFIHSGDWHLHTNVTDGESSIKECFERAQENSLKFILFSEHVRRNLDYNYFKFKEDVYSAGANFSIKFAAGAEAKVLDEDGNLDISDRIADEADVILFAFHSSFFKTKDSYLKAIINTSSNPIVDIWAHPMIYHNRLGFNITMSEWENIAEHLNGNNVCYELNKKYLCSDVAELRQIIKYNVSVIFGSDAHHANDLLKLEDIEYFKQLLSI